jgi:hypothetical protein
MDDVTDRVTEPDAAADDLVPVGDEGARAEPETPADRPRPRRIDRGLLLASLAIACGLVLIIFGVTTALTGNDGIDRPEGIESVQPVENAVQVLQQERIVVDLQAGYEARLIVDGIELPTTIIGQSDVDPFEQPAPGQQVELPTTAVYDPGNAVISFQPVEGAAIESFTQGLHEVQVIFWRIEDGQEQARSYRWEFNVV